MAKRYLARSRAPEDVTGLAGWLFTDLLLGLVMVFISAVAFVAYKSVGEEGSPGTPICENYAGTFEQEPLRLEYKKGEGSEVRKDIENYIEKKTLEKRKTSEIFENPRVAVGLIYGWYDESERSNAGVTLAKAFYDRFHKSDPDNFKPFNEDGKVPNMRFQGSAKDFAPIEGAGVELFFVYDTCSKSEISPVTIIP